MPEFPLEFATRQIRRTFERAIGKSIVKILTELITNSDDSYRRITEAAIQGGGTHAPADPAPIVILFDRAKRRFSVIDHGEGLTHEEMQQRFVTYGQESGDRSKGYRTRSLFGKGLRDVLFTQRNGQVKSIRNRLFYNCRFKWKGAGGQERPIVDIRPPSRITSELRQALRIPQNGTLVEFVLRDDVHNPQPDKLLDALSNFYMLRMINSSPHRKVVLLIQGRDGQIQERPLKYRFPEIEVKKHLREAMTTDLDTEITIEAEIGVATRELTQGEVGYSEREGGLLVLDEDDAALDLHLFGFDDDPAARRLSGTVRLIGAGTYIRSKLNQADPEEVLTETREGFDKQHTFYRLLREKLYPRLEPLVARLRELGPTPKVNLSDKTRERHQQALDILNRLASEMLGRQARVPVIPASKRTPPPQGIAFANSHISVQTGVATPAVLLINTSAVSPNDVIDIASDCAEIIVRPQTVALAPEDSEGSVAVKIVRVISNVADVSGKISAHWKGITAVLDVTTTMREVLTPVNGLEFESDEYNVRLRAKRHLRLFVDAERIPVGSEISILVEDPAIEVAESRIVVVPGHLVTPNVAEIEITVTGVDVRRDVIVTAAHAAYVAGTQVSVVKREKPDRGKQGLFKDYKFYPLERKVQTQLVPEGYILINTKDPVNARYFGDDPGKAVEEDAHCQVRLADLILNECLQFMVSQALDSGRLEQRFLNRPQDDIRSYVEEKKFEIGPEIHDKFVTKA